MMGKNSSNIASAGVLYLIFLIYALSTGLLGSVMAMLITDFNVSISSGGTFSIVQYAGSAVGILFSGRMLCKMSKWKILIIFDVIFAIGMLLVLGVSGIVFFLILMLIVGIATKIIDITANAAISQMFTENKGVFMNLLHACFGIGNFIGPIMASSMLEKGIRWQMAYFVVGIIAASGFVVLFVFSKTANASVLEPDNKEKLEVARLLKNKRIWLLIIILFFYCGHQIGASSWMPMYLAEVKGAGTIIAGIGISMFWLGLIISRLGCSFLSTRINVRKLLCIGAVLGAILYGAGISFANIYISIAGCTCAGLFAGATIPLCMTIGYEDNPEYQATVSMLLFLSICAGQIVFPWLMGLIGETAGLSAAISCNVGLLGLTAVFGAILLLSESGKTAVY